MQNNFSSFLVGYNSHIQTHTNTEPSSLILLRLFPQDEWFPVVSTYNRVQNKLMQKTRRNDSRRTRRRGRKGTDKDRCQWKRDTSLIPSDVISFHFQPPLCHITLVFTCLYLLYTYVRVHIIPLYCHSFCAWKKEIG